MNFQELAARFGITAPIVAEEEIHAGNINSTYLITVEEATGESKQYIFQRVNTFVFKHPEDVMSNIIKVTEHVKARMLEEGGSYERRVLSFLKTEDGLPYYYTSAHHFFRVYEYVADAVAYNAVESPEQFFEAGREFGEFQGWLSDFEADDLVEIIPNFHNTPMRYKALHEAIENNRAGRVDEVAEEIRFLLDREEDCGVIVNAINEGRVPRRVTHNDTKINNILFDVNSDKAICVIDLDTVMPGSSAYDFGDAIRFGASTTAEDDPDFSNVSLNLDLYEQFTRGFIAGAEGLLLEEELSLLPYGAYIMTLELIVRFLTDYLNGDEYFKIKYPAHNLVRSRNQMHLLKDMERKWDRMCELITECTAK